MPIAPKLHRAQTPRGRAIPLGGKLLAACATLILTLGGESRAASQLSFPLRNAMVSMLTKPSQTAITVTGSAAVADAQRPVAGSLTKTVEPATDPTTFAGQNALRTTIYLNGSMHADDLPLALSASMHTYFSPTHALLGYEQPAIHRHCVADAGAAYPETVRPGDAGLVAHYACYTDASLLEPIGTETVEYAVHAGTNPDAALVTLTTTRHDTTGQQQSLMVNTYQITTAGSLDLLSSLIHRSELAEHDKPQDGTVTVRPSFLDLHYAEP